MREEVNGNLKGALKIHTGLAEKGFAQSINYLGVAYAKGLGVERNIPLSVEYYKKAAALGNSTAQLNLGDYYMNTMSVDYDPEKAVELYTLSAANAVEPDADAMFRLYICYRNGRGVAVCEEEAEKWRILAEQNGVTEYVDYSGR